MHMFSFPDHLPSNDVPKDVDFETWRLNSTARPPQILSDPHANAARAMAGLPEHVSIY
jgi:hypothetical protein